MSRVIAVVLLLAACGGSSTSATVVTAQCKWDADGKLTASVPIPKDVSFVTVALCEFHPIPAPGHDASACDGVTVKSGSVGFNEPDNCSMQFSADPALKDGVAIADCDLGNLGFDVVSDNKGDTCEGAFTSARFLFQ